MIICTSGAIPEQRNFPAILCIYPRKLGGKPEKYHLSPCGIPASGGPLQRKRERESTWPPEKGSRSVGRRGRLSNGIPLPPSFLSPLFSCRPPADDLYIYTTCVYERETRLWEEGCLIILRCEGNCRREVKNGWWVLGEGQRVGKLWPAVDSSLSPSLDSLFILFHLIACCCRINFLTSCLFSPVLL